MSSARPTKSPRVARSLAAAVLAAMSTGAGGLRAQQAPDGPAATRPALADAVIVTSIEGKARARNDPDAEWKLVEVGMRLPQGAQIQTGQSGRVVCAIPPGREFVVDRLSTVTVLE